MKTALALATAVLMLSFAGPALGDRFITDTLAPGGTPQAPVHFVTDTLAPGGGSSPAQVERVQSFSWSDAGVGAGIGAGVLLALMGSTLVVVHRRDRLAL